MVIETTGLADPAPIIQTFRSIQVPFDTQARMSYVRHALLSQEALDRLRLLCQSLYRAYVSRVLDFIYAWRWK